MTTKSEKARVKRVADKHRMFVKLYGVQPKPTPKSNGVKQ
jgi:hypothetical protein